MSRFRKSARALAAAVLLAAVTLLALLSPTPGHAQTVNTYLSNFGQGMDHYNAFQDNRAQSFRTGPQAGGYTVTSVDIVSEDPQGDAFSAAIYSVDSNGYPDSQVAALTAPSSFAAGTLTFTAPANTTLSANTTYTVRIVKNDSSPAVVLSLDSTTSNAEDFGGASGWSIGNGIHRWDSYNGAWYLNSSTGAIRIAVKGTTTVNNPATGAPAITGPAQVGQTLTAVISGIMDADGLTTPGYTYRWIRVDGSIDAAIPGATSSAYTLAAADRGKIIKVRVSFTDNAGFSETLTSSATAAVAVAANNLATGAPTITGPAQVGQTLTAVISGIMDADGLNTPGYTYQWIRVDGGIDADIPGATSSAYALAAADQGKTIKVRVGFTDDAGYSETPTSSATGLGDLLSDVQQAWIGGTDVGIERVPADQDMDFV